MVKRRRKSHFSPEFREQAVRMVLEEGRSATQVAKELGFSPSALCKWVRQAQQEKEQAPMLAPDERLELEQLRQENRILKQERDILKKSVAFFIKDSA